MMDSGCQQRYRDAPHSANECVGYACTVGPKYESRSAARMDTEDLNTAQAIAKHSEPSTEILENLRAGQVLMVNSRRRNGLILLKRFHAEFAGPGAVIGGRFDSDCEQVVTVGKLSLLVPKSYEERQAAYKIRLQWIKLTKQFTDNEMPLERARKILEQFEQYFDTEEVQGIPDEAFARLVGVLPKTVRQARRRPEKLNLKVRA